MRLIHTRTGQFHTFDDPRVVRYAILSHVWAKKDDTRFFPEPTYQDILRIQADYAAQVPAERKPIIHQLPEKIRRFCQTADNHHYEYAWGDSFCIDKTSSSELSEAINSMFDWYRYAGVCYVYLHDVPSVTTTAELETRKSPFRRSTWHRRGWTLQELLAPAVVVFFSEEWIIIGTKHTLATLISEITTIHRDVLTFQRSLDDFSIACRMSWAATRKTTKEEDEAYSLLGILGVNMPTTYGEGRYAFIRLQEEILKHVPDQTIFVWGPCLRAAPFTYYSPKTTQHTGDSPSDQLHIGFGVKSTSHYQFLFASSPRDFKYSSNVESIPWDDFLSKLNGPSQARATYLPTSYGVCTRLPLVLVSSADRKLSGPARIALLACKVRDDAGEDRYIGLLLRDQVTGRGGDYLVGAVVGKLDDFMDSHKDNAQPSSMISMLSDHYYRTAWLSHEDWSHCSRACETLEVYIPYRPSLASYSLLRDANTHSSICSISPQDTHFDLRISKWSEDVLKLHGYRATHHAGRDPHSIDLTNTVESEIIGISVGRCECSYGDREGFLNVDVFLHDPVVDVPEDSSVPHERNHHRHVHSWTLKNGSAAKEFRLQTRSRRLTTRLTLTKSRENSQWPVYILGVEIWKTSPEELRRERAERSELQRQVREHGRQIVGRMGEQGSELPPQLGASSPPTPPDSRVPSLQQGVTPDPWYRPALGHVEPRADCRMPNQQDSSRTDKIPPWRFLRAAVAGAAAFTTARYPTSTHVEPLDDPPPGPPVAGPSSRRDLTPMKASDWENHAYPEQRSSYHLSPVREEGAYEDAYSERDERPTPSKKRSIASATEAPLDPSPHVLVDRQRYRMSPEPTGPSTPLYMQASALEDRRRGTIPREGGRPRGTTGEIEEVLRIQTGERHGARLQSLPDNAEELTIGYERREYSY
ncbi:hypothetical protein ONZ51_g10349 [Trametes cubensis]|uniref:Vegetative incompatibility protein HET-E-1 n=1 Tax=Trametes cubensis TaxID=1111947 RepID=A0AAD7TJM7_9APHY|nr:hypothetical protein ONZ51_g10349 [Trametes cubensis]